MSNHRREPAANPLPPRRSGGASSVSRSYRLHGRLEGVVQTYLLRPGVNDVGSSPESGVYLPFRGVSRRHARLTVGDGGVGVEDLESKNGTFVDGRQVAGETVSPGRRIRFGSVELELEEAVGEAASLGLVLHDDGDRDRSDRDRSDRERADRDRADARGTIESTALLDGSVPEGSVALLGRAAATLREKGLGDALESLGEHVGAAAGCLCEWPPASGPRVWGVSGEVPDESLVREIMKRGAGWVESCGPGFHLHVLPAGEGRSVTAALSVGDSGRHCLLFSPAVGLEPALAEAFLQLVLAWRAGAEASGRAGSSGRRGGPRLDLPDGFVPGRSLAWRSQQQAMERAAADDLPVLITGETGVGKELAARIVHRSSARRREPFLAVNCAAIPADLLEAEMFGVERGAATGVEARPGYFVRADGGTLLLDEIGELHPSLQAKLLRALDGGEIRPLGGRVRRVDVRTLAATNRDLVRQVDSGRFRADLYYRIACHLIEVPPLRERPEDVPLLVERMLRRAVEESGKRIAGVTMPALRALCTDPWPGNVRELGNELRRLVSRCAPGGVIDLDLLSHRMIPSDREDAAVRPGPRERPQTLKQRLDALEAELIRRTLEETRWNRSAAARILGVSRTGLAKKIRRLELE